MALIIFTNRVFSQKLDGVYFGKIIHAKNVLVVKNEGTEVKGAIYLDKTNKLDFLGTYAKPFLKGVVHLPNGAEIPIQCELKRNSLKLTYLDSSEQIVSVLNKISSKTAYGIDELFSENYNPLLFGKWEILKETNSSGAEIDRVAKHTYEFARRGHAFFNITSVQGMDDGFISRIGKPVEMKWSTTEKEITLTIKTTNVENYSIKGDTLIITSPSGASALFIRK